MFRRTVCFLTFLLASISLSHAADPGARDTVRFIPDTLVVGESRPVRVEIINDEAIASMAFHIQISELSGYARFDSVRWGGQLADPTVFDFRHAHILNANGTSPDTIGVVALRFISQSQYQAARQVPFELFFTGLTAGVMRIDTCTRNAGYINGFGLSPNGFVYPHIEMADLVVLPASSLRLEVQNADTATVGGVEVRIPVRYQPEMATLVVNSIQSPDQPTRQPSSFPELFFSPDTALVWSPTLQDVGVWGVSLRAWLNGQFREAVVNVRVFSDASNAIAFEVHESQAHIAVNGLSAVDLDGDGVSEVIASGPGSEASMSFMLGVSVTLPNGQCQVVDSIRGGIGYANLQVGFIDEDTYPDLIAHRQFNARGIEFLQGRGDGTFVKPTSNIASDLVGIGTLSELTGDANLDYVTSRTVNLRVWAGNGSGGLSPFQNIIAADSVKSVQAVDLNEDGRAELLVGLVTGLQIYLKSDSNFVTGEFYPYAHGVADIDITNDVSDLNGDGKVDLIVATPSVGGEFSEIRTFLGNGDGTLQVGVIKQLAGQVLSGVLGDFNDDGRIDFASVNGAQRYLSIHYGDGLGGFIDESRFSVPRYSPSRIVATDFDRDGDLDLVVSSFQLTRGSSLFVYENGLNPVGQTPAHIVSQVCDNAAVTIHTPAGREFGKIRSTVSASSIMERSIDNDEIIDKVMTLGVVESGRYIYHALPNSLLNPYATFSLEVRTSDRILRFADDLPNRVAGYQFPAYLDGSAPVSPEPGAIVGVASAITFTWQDNGAVRFQIASTPDFASLLTDTVLSAGTIQTSLPLTGSDSTTYYWRTVHEGTTESEIYPLTVYAASPTDADDEPNGLPRAFALDQNYPNPFNPTTNISFSLPERSNVRLEIFSILGQRVRALFEETRAAGSYVVSWDGKDDQGAAVASGVYLYQLTTDTERASRSMMLLK